MRSIRRPTVAATLTLSATFGVALTFAFAATAGIADAPSPEGRPLPDALRALIWQKACDVPDHDYSIDCAENQDPLRCAYRRSDGTAFQPHQSDGARTFGFAHYGVPRAVLGPAATDSGWTETEDKWGDITGPAFQFISGLTLATSKPYDLTVLTPEALAWIRRELVPERAQAMCGKTAGELYDVSAKNVLQATTVAWEFVKKSGLLKGLTVARLSKEHDARNGATWTKCVNFAEKAATPAYDARMLRDECQFWLRRGAAKQADAVASVLGLVLERFDPTFYAEHAKAFPVPKAVKVP